MMHRVTRSSAYTSYADEHYHARTRSVYVRDKYVGLTYVYYWRRTGVIYRNLPDFEAAWDEHLAAKRARKERLR